jgi:hypothetical protein
MEFGWRLSDSGRTVGYFCYLHRNKQTMPPEGIYRVVSIDSNGAASGLSAHLAASILRGSRLSQKTH